MTDCIDLPLCQQGACLIGKSGVLLMLVKLCSNRKTEILTSTSLYSALAVNQKYNKKVNTGNRDFQLAFCNFL